MFESTSHFGEVDIRDQDLITVKIAKELQRVRSVGSLVIWCDVTRAAMRYVISRPNLRELVVFGLKHPGKLTGFERASGLEKLVCMYGVSEDDLFEFSKLPNLKSIDVKFSNLTRRALERLLLMPTLTSIDVEDTEFDDDMASIVSQSETITELEVGASKLTSKGFRKICRMKQLAVLDVWSTDITEADLEHLSRLPNLAYLSIGGFEDQTRLTAAGVIPHLERIKSLKRLWLDGIPMTPGQREMLEARYEKVRF